MQYSEPSLTVKREDRKPVSSIGQIIADIRRERKLQSKYVAITAGIESSRYSRIETGKLDPSDEEVAAITLAMETDLIEVIARWQANLASVRVERKMVGPYGSGGIKKDGTRGGGGN